MTPFVYQRPATLGDAVSALTGGGPATKILAGGQSLLLALKERQARPTQLVAVKNLDELQGVSHLPDGSLRIGAAMSYAALSRLNLPGWHGTLAAVAGNLADRSVRNMGTIGGGVCQADPRYDMPIFLTAASAQFNLVSVRGERCMASGDFFNPQGGTNIANDEILTAIILPPVARFSAVVFEKFCFRTFEAAIVNVAASVKLDGTGQISEVRFAVGGVAKAPGVAACTAQAIRGQLINELDIDFVANGISEEILPPETLVDRRRKYLAELTVSLAKRVLQTLKQAGEMA